MDASWEAAMASRSASKVFPGFGSLYELADPGSDRAFVASINMSPESALATLRDEARGQSVISGQWAMGGAKPRDFVWTTLALPVLVSPRVVAVLRGNDFTGWAVSPCELRDKNNRVLPYNFLRVHGRCGAVEDSRSDQIEKVYPGGIFPVWRGLYFDPATWDGSDVFMPSGSVGWIFVTDSVKRALEEAKIENVLFTALDHVERVQLTGSRHGSTN